ncbi:MAG: UDP-glycosyltransferase [Pseudomonadota bacterium]|nr:UDP-glycosyltransferase [Pseudomonadota bacterium]
MQPRLLFAAYGGGHIRMLMPVLEHLRRRGDCDLHVLALTTARPVVEAAGFRALGFRDIAGPGDAAALEKGRELAMALGQGQIVDMAESAAYLGLSWQELERDLGPEQARARYAAVGRGAFFPLATMHRLLAKLDPDLVVATNSPRAERALVEAADARNIPALCLGDLFLDFEWEWVAKPGFGRRVGVMSESVRQHLIDCGRPAGEIVVTGNPAFDRLGDPAVREAGLALRTALGWTDNPVVAWGMPHIPPGDTRIALPGPTLAALRALSAARPDLRFIVRPHPNNTDRLDELPPAFRLSPREEDVHAVIHACDLLVTEISTVGLEAVLAGKPVITINSRAVIPYAELGITREIDHAGQLADAIVDELARPTPGRLDRLGAPPVGKATPNVIALIDSLLADGPVRHGAAAR